MKNITVTIPDEIYLTARISAARRSTSVSALVRQFLESLDDDPDLDLGFPDNEWAANETDPHPPYFLCNCETVINGPDAATADSCN